MGNWEIFLADKLVLDRPDAPSPTASSYALPLGSVHHAKIGVAANATYGFTRTVLDGCCPAIRRNTSQIGFDVGRTFRDDMFTDIKSFLRKCPTVLELTYSSGDPP